MVPLQPADTPDVCGKQTEKWRLLLKFTAKLKRSIACTLCDYHSIWVHKSISNQKDFFFCNNFLLIEKITLCKQTVVSGLFFLCHSSLRSLLIFLYLEIMYIF